MKKIADLGFYGFVLLFQILSKKFKGYYFSETFIDQGYFQVSAAPEDERNNGEVVLEVFDPVYADEILGSFANCNTSSNKITIGFYVANFTTFKYQLSKKDLDNPIVINELKKIIGLSVHIGDKSKDWGRDVKKWTKKTIKESKLNKYLEEVK